MRARRPDGPAGGTDDQPGQHRHDHPNDPPPSCDGPARPNPTDANPAGPATPGGTRPAGGAPAPSPTPPAGPATHAGLHGPQTPKSRPTSNPRYLALLRIDIEALRRGHIQGDELCEIRGVGPIPVPIARTLLGDAIIKLVITRGVDVANITHLGRGPTAAQRAALLWTTPNCTVQGCPRTQTEIDHREPWEHTRHTRLDELDPLCAFHHDLKTRLGWALIPGTGKRPLVPPDHPQHPTRHHPGDGEGPAGDGDRPPDDGDGKRRANGGHPRADNATTILPEQRPSRTLPEQPAMFAPEDDRGP